MKLYYRRSCRISLLIRTCADRHLEVFENVNRTLARRAVTINICASGESFRLDDHEGGGETESDAARIENKTASR